MTFLPSQEPCAIPVGQAGNPYGWGDPQGWRIRCDDCGEVMPYTPPWPQPRGWTSEGGNRHYCVTHQLGLFA